MHNIKFIEIYVSAMRSESEYSLFREASAGWDGSPELKIIGDKIDDYEREGKYKIANLLCKHTIEKLERDRGHYDPNVALFLNILAFSYRDRGMFEECEKLLEEVLDIREKTLGSNHTAVSYSLNNLASLYSNMGKFFLLYFLVL